MRQEFAWIEHENKVYVTQGFREFGKPHAPVTILIQSIFDLYQDLSFFILRKKIFTTGQATEFEKSMVFLAGKRLQDNSRFDEDQYVGQGIEIVQIQGPVFKSQLAIKDVFLEQPLSQYLESVSVTPQIVAVYLTEALDRVSRGQVLHDHNRKIAAAIISSQGQLLRASFANNYMNKTLHAEVCCLQNCDYQQGCYLVVTLKPCRMCADMAWHWSGGDPRFEIFYLQNDPGPKAQGSRLEKEGRLKLLKSLPTNIDQL